MLLGLYFLAAAFRLFVPSQPPVSCDKGLIMLGKRLATLSTPPSGQEVSTCVCSFCVKLPGLW